MRPSNQLQVWCQATRRAMTGDVFFGFSVATGLLVRTRLGDNGDAYSLIVDQLPLPLLSSREAKGVYSLGHSKNASFFSSLVWILSWGSKKERNLSSPCVCRPFFGYPRAWVFKENSCLCIFCKCYLQARRDRNVARSRLQVLDA